MHTPLHERCTDLDTLPFPDLTLVDGNERITQHPHHDQLGLPVRLQLLLGDGDVRAQVPLPQRRERGRRDQGEEAQEDLLLRRQLRRQQEAPQAAAAADDRRGHHGAVGRPGAHRRRARPRAARAHAGLGGRLRRPRPRVGQPGHARPASRSRRPSTTSSRPSRSCTTTASAATACSCSAPTTTPRSRCATPSTSRCKNQIDTVMLNILTPLPGTQQFADLDAEGRIIDRDWSFYDAQHVVFRPRHMTPLHLLRETLRANRRFYRTLAARDRHVHAGSGSATSTAGTGCSSTAGCGATRACGARIRATAPSAARLRGPASRTHPHERRRRSPLRRRRRAPGRDPARVRRGRSRLQKRRSQRSARAYPAPARGTSRRARAPLAARDTARRQETHMATATFAAGCFWGVEAALRRAAGRHQHRGRLHRRHDAHPTYEQVCSHTHRPRRGRPPRVRPERDQLRGAPGGLLRHARSDAARTGRARTSATSTARPIFFHTPEQETAARPTIRALDARAASSSGRSSRRSLPARRVVARRGVPSEVLREARAASGCSHLRRSTPAQAVQMLDEDAHADDDEDDAADDLHAAAEQGAEAFAELQADGVRPRRRRRSRWPGTRWARRAARARGRRRARRCWSPRRAGPATSPSSGRCARASSSPCLKRLVDHLAADDGRAGRRRSSGRSGRSSPPTVRPASQPRTGMNAWKRPKCQASRKVWRGVTCLEREPGADGDGEGVHGEADGDADERERRHGASRRQRDGAAEASAEGDVDGRGRDADGDGEGVGVGVGLGMRYFVRSRIVLSDRMLWNFARPGSTRWKMSKKSRSRKCAAADEVQPGDVPAPRPGSRSRRDTARPGRRTRSRSPAGRAAGRGARREGDGACRRG